jgi:hypothetical protein
MKNLRFTGDGKFDCSIISILWSIIVISLLGCSPEEKTQMTPVPTISRTPASSTTTAASQMLTPFAVGDEQTDAIVRRLTGSKWQRVDTQDPGLASEIVTWEFYSNGTFRWQFTSDFSETYAGAWSISRTSGESGVMFLAGNVNDLSRFEVLSFQLQSGGLMLGEFPYEETPFASTDAPPEARQEDHQAVTDQRDDVFSLWTALTASDWQSESDPAPGDANSYSFIKDGTYTARFDVTQCQYSGTWSASASGGETGTVRLSVPANACDSRGFQEAIVREIPVALAGDQLILFETVYVPVPR